MKLLSLGTLWLTLAAGLQAQSETFVVGNAHYEAGRFDSALVSYEAILHGGLESTVLYYNIGNAYFKLGNLGKAALSFHRALRLDPRHEDALANLDLVSNLAIDDVTPLPGFWPVRIIHWWVTLIPTGVLAWLAGLGYVLAAFGAIGVILNSSSRWSSVGQRGILIGGLMAVMFGVTLAAREYKWGQATEGVVVVDEITARSAPVDDPSLNVFTIHEATKIRVDDRSETWVEIVLEDGQVGWILADAIEII